MLLPPTTGLLTLFAGLLFASLIISIRVCSSVSFSHSRGSRRELCRARIGREGMEYGTMAAQIANQMNLYSTKLRYAVVNGPGIHLDASRALRDETHDAR